MREATEPPSAADIESSATGKTRWSGSGVPYLLTDACLPIDVKGHKVHLTSPLQVNLRHLGLSIADQT